MIDLRPNRHKGGTKERHRNGAMNRRTRIEPTHGLRHLEQIPLKHAHHALHDGRVQIRGCLCACVRAWVFAATRIGTEMPEKRRLITYKLHADKVNSAVFILDAKNWNNWMLLGSYD